MPITNSFPPPSTEEEGPVVIKATVVLSGMVVFFIVSLLYAVILNGLYVIADHGGIVDWSLSFLDIFLAVLFVQFIRVLDAVWKRRLQ